MRDERGKSKCFGYVNFVEKSAAELSANNLKGRTVEGARIKVKGPRELEKNYGQGLSLPANSTQKMDYRPYTDCDFFVRGKECNPKSKRVRLYVHTKCVYVRFSGRTAAGLLVKLESHVTFETLNVTSPERCVFGSSAHT